MAFIMAGAFSVRAQTQTPQETNYLSLLETAANDLQSVTAGFSDDLSEDERAQLRQKITTARSTAQDTVDAMQKELNLVAEREAQLGPVAEDVTETPDILAQRQELARTRGVLESAIKRGRLLSVEADQLSDRLAASRAEQISNEAAKRVSSPLAPQFWVSFADQADGDLRRGLRLTEVAGSRFMEGWDKGALWLIAALALLVMLWGPVRVWLKRVGQGLMTRITPPARIRRSMNALWRVAVETLLPLIGLTLIAHALRLPGMLHPRLDPVMDALVSGAVTGSFVISLAGALLMRDQPSWRLLPVSDALAVALRPWTWALGGLIVLMTVGEPLAEAISASAPLKSLLDIFTVIGLMGLFAGALVSVARLRAQTDPTEAKRSPGLGILSMTAWLVVVAGTLAICLGYVGFGLLLMRMVLWVIIVLAVLYMAWVAAEDVLTTVFNATSRTGKAIITLTGVRPAFVDQVGVVLSGVAHVGMAFVALAVLLFPFGAGVSSIFDQFARVAKGITLGEMTLSPGALAQALIVLVAGLAGVRMFQSWLDNRYLPKTELDSGARNSISTVARYAGFIIVGLWALASLGIGVERIALLLSALSVGIGFGLQAITQNFISGLILLAERPVKIGDWVRIGSDEGDIRRINVRSTEIILADHSTLIVPNSELITKSVLNKTHADPLGRVQIEFSVPLGIDVARVRDIVLSVFADEPRVREAPAPAVFIDGIADGRVGFNCFAHVGNARDAYSARSAILLDLLKRFHEEEIDVGTAPQRMELVPLPEAPPPETA